MVKPLVNDYGMIIVDECHHVSAESFECVLKAVHAKYVCGLNATPKRSDGHQPIIFMQCGAIRYSADAKADNTYAERMHQMMAAHDIEHHIKNNIQSSFVVIDGKQFGMPAANCSGQQKMNVCCELRMRCLQRN